ncbi:flagellin-stabilizing protein FliW [Syntrophotalea carbinolica DSM 2380]|uniref:Flagellar assembly factor FliW n=1 Tax=Syntrophotalea carbinolica (strain DSM 2380 / NBRC 103641 / GraBd1) TaxID=338963 RepID=FLIW_SYNC1|nr:flagellar assembly protein FliW [Syntrophotalea carbinolica]Q3A5G2.1 RecName: Full=Flagellar assembly factor FliW [Syntrophotalea carbinolica DSM 2380]ABA88395.1 flagellin-stabilizing protein FliW [Syntrophotalea carbinolica DSM 2380]
MKKTIMTRFGEVEFDPENTVLFVDGLIGFENLRDFIVMPNRKNGPLFWIQSVEEPDLAFVLTDPTNFFLDYKVVPDARERAKLGIGTDDDCHALAVVTVPPDRKVTLNLMAPVLFAPATNRAIQVVLEKSQYKTRHPLPA